MTPQISLNFLYIPVIVVEWPTSLSNLGYFFFSNRFPFIHFEGNSKYFSLYFGLIPSKLFLFIFRTRVLPPKSREAIFLH